MYLIEINLIETVIIPFERPRPRIFEDSPLNGTEDDAGIPDFPQESFPEVTSSVSVQMSSGGSSSNIIMPWTSSASHRPTQRPPYIASSELPPTTSSPYSTEKT